MEYEGHERVEETSEKGVKKVKYYNLKGYDVKKLLGTYPNRVP